MRRSSRCSIVVFALVAALCAGVGAAGATRTIAVPSKVSIKSDSLDFSGRLTTGAYQPCRQRRKVLLFKVVSNGPDQAIGRDTTNDKGAWSISPLGWAGISLAHFYAKVTRSSQGAAGTIYVCRAARSKTIRLST
jgi:hypothetical protein